MINTYLDALIFMNTIKDEIPILVYYYHPEKPYSFRSAREFPYSSMSEKRTMQHSEHYTMHFDAINKNDVILLTTFSEFQTTSTLLAGLKSFIFLKGLGYERDVLYSKSEIQHFFNNFREVVFQEPKHHPFANFDDGQKSEIKKRIRRLEIITESKERASCARGDNYGIAVQKDEKALLWQKRHRQKMAIEKGLYRILGL